MQELILIDRSIGKLVTFLEKIDLLIEKNERLLIKTSLRMQISSLMQLAENISNELKDQRKQSLKIEERLKD